MIRDDDDDSLNTAASKKIEKSTIIVTMDLIISLKKHN